MHTIYKGMQHYSFNVQVGYIIKISCDIQEVKIYKFVKLSVKTDDTA